MRPALEVADVFRRHGEAFRHAHGAHLGRVERRVMAAIEACRTPTLGGHVEQCGDCGLIRCAYNSCLMGEFSNRESAGSPLQWVVFVDSFALHYRGIPEQGDQLVRGPEGAFAQMWRHDRLDGFELFGGIATRIDFSACQGGMPQPKGDLADVLRRL